MSGFINRLNTDRAFAINILLALLTFIVIIMAILANFFINNLNTFKQCLSQNSTYEYLNKIIKVVLFGSSLLYIPLGFYFGKSWGCM